MRDGDVSRLLTLSDSEVKRIGGDAATLVHLAEVLRRRWTDEFTSAFVEADLAALAHLVRTRSWTGDRDAIRRLAEAADDVPALVVALRAELADALAAAAGAAASGPDGTPAADAPATADSVPGKPVAPYDLGGPRTVPAVAPRSIVDRDVELTHLLAAARLVRRRPVLVVGDPGSGRTALLGALAGALAGDPGRSVSRLGPSDLTWRPEGVWQQLAARVPDDGILCLDDLDRTARLTTSVPNGEFLVQLVAAADAARVQLVLVATPEGARKLEALFPEFTEDLTRVEVAPLADAALAAVVEAAAGELAAAHGVRISEAARQVACTAPRSSEHRAHPGLAIDRLDAACARVTLAGREVVDADDIETVALDVTVPGRDALAAALAARVKGQDNAIDRLADRLALTTASLDLRPERPDGVFLFVGPTGVGKTELARALADVLCGGPDNLIRLDMSEYAHDWAVSRITGPAPGYVGSDEPSSWLTTRVAARPRSVVLLDEIEKAHPAVWNTFLQAFDVGRLTDGRGTVADLSKVVFVMTSNLGVEQATKAAVGFGAGGADGVLTDHDGMAARVMTVVRDRLAPELLNRLDDVIVFRALTTSDITAIARLELERIRKRLSDRGRVVEYAAGVAEYLAGKGYDPAYGARHLQRSIERYLLTTIAKSGTNAVRITVDGDALTLG